MRSAFIRPRICAGVSNPGARSGRYSHWGYVPNNPDAQLRFPEVTCGRHFGNHLARPQMGSLDIGDRVFGNFSLFVARVENRRTIAGPPVVALAIESGRVVALKEEFQKRPVTRLGRIEDDLDRLGVPFVVSIRGVSHGAACVPDPCGNHAGWRRIKSCTPQKQPPARTARSSVILSPPLDPDRRRNPRLPFYHAE